MEKECHNGENNVTIELPIVLYLVIVDGVCLRAHTNMDKAEKSIKELELAYEKIAVVLGEHSSVKFEIRTVLLEA